MLLVCKYIITPVVVILNMAIGELVLLITKVFEAIKGIHSRQQRENAPEAQK